MRGGAVAAITAQRRQNKSSSSSSGGAGRSSEGNSSSLSSMTSVLGAVKKKATQTVSVAGTAARQGMGIAKDKLGISRASQKVEEKPLHSAGQLEEVQGIHETDADDLKQLVGMGFSRTDATWALRQAGAGNVQEAALLLSSEPTESEVLTSEAEHQGEVEVAADNEASAGWWGQAQWEAPFERGSWVQCHGFQSSEARVLNGKVGQVIRYNSSHRRFVVRLSGELKMIRAANLKKASMASSVHAEMKASLKGTMGSMKDMGRKAGAFLSTSKSKNEQAEREVVTPVDPSKRDAALKAAEQRLATAKARSGGTMDDWRRQQRESQESRLLEIRRNKENQTQSRLTPGDVPVAPSVDTRDDATQCSTREPLTADDEPELLDVGDGDLEITAEEHEAIIEQDFAMQQALALSLESGRDLLDQERVEQACAASELVQDEQSSKANDEGSNQRHDLDGSFQAVKVHDESTECMGQDTSGSIPPVVDNAEKQPEKSNDDVPEAIAVPQSHAEGGVLDAKSDEQQIEAPNGSPTQCSSLEEQHLAVEDSLAHEDENLASRELEADLGSPSPCAMEGIPRQNVLPLDEQTLAAEDSLAHDGEKSNEEEIVAEGGSQSQCEIEGGAEEN